MVMWGRTTLETPLSDVSWEKRGPKTCVPLYFVWDPGSTTSSDVEVEIIPIPTLPPTPSRITTQEDWRGLFTGLEGRSGSLEPVPSRRKDVSYPGRSSSCLTRPLIEYPRFFFNDLFATESPNGWVTHKVEGTPLPFSDLSPKVLAGVPRERLPVFTARTSSSRGDTVHVFYVKPT